MFELASAAEYIFGFFCDILPEDTSSITASTIVPLILALIERDNKSPGTFQYLFYFELVGFHFVFLTSIQPASLRVSVQGQSGSIHVPSNGLMERDALPRHGLHRVLYDYFGDYILD